MALPLQQRARRLWYSSAVGKALVVLFIGMIFLTIYSLDNRRDLNRTVRVVEEQTLVIRAQCTVFQDDPTGCRDLLSRLIHNATPEQLAQLQREGLRGRPGATGATGPAGRDGADGKNGATGKVGPASTIPGPPGRSIVGPRGLQGPVGPQGVAGPVGPQGVAGISPSVQAVVQQVLAQLRQLLPPGLL